MKKLYKPTTAIQNNSVRGIVALSKNTKSDYIKSKLDKFTTPIAKGELTLDEVKELYQFLLKKESNYEPMKRVEKGNLSLDTAAYLAAGGSSALAWTRMILKSEGILKSYTKEITEEQTEKEETIKGFNLPITKAVNEELMQATFVVMVPGEVDLHGDVTTEDEVRKACHNFNKYCMKANLFHLVETDTFEFCESFCTPSDFILGDKEVKKGTWLCTIQCLDDELWTLIKSGEINGVSIGAMATVETLEETESEE